MKVILGGGLVGLLARDILGPSWKIIPMGRSQYYSFNPPLADDYIVRDSTINSYLDNFSAIPICIKTAFSIAGQISYNHNLCLEQWLHKVFGSVVPPQSAPYWRTHLEYFASSSCLEIYTRLQERYKDEIIEAVDKLGKATRIANNIITTEKGVVEYDEMISAIPLPALLKILGDARELPAKDIWYYHIMTDRLDFEGATNTLVCDPEIDFYRVSEIGNNNYIIYSTKEIIQPARYLMSIIERFELIGETKIEGAMPCGIIPDLESVKKANITCLGITATHDHCCDIGTVIKRLLRRGSEVI